MEVRRKKQIVTSSRVTQTMIRLEAMQPELSAKEMKAEMEWLLQLYERELVEKCGGMSIVEKNLLPWGS
jgi:hypothetical protein